MEVRRCIELFYLVVIGNIFLQAYMVYRNRHLLKFKRTQMKVPDNTLQRSFSTTVLANSSVNVQTVEPTLKDGQDYMTPKKNITTIKTSQHFGVKRIWHLDPSHIQENWFDSRYKHMMVFNDCKHSNCIYETVKSHRDVTGVDLVLSDVSLSRAASYQRGKAWLAYTHEPATHFRWPPETNSLSGTIEYTRNSAVYFPFGEKMANLNSTTSENFDYAGNKVRGAFAYVSNCTSVGYNRLGTMRQLSAYIDVDIFGRCTDNIPCSRMNFTCEQLVHKSYRFYLAFENSLCEDYITEKFWKTLNSPAGFVPVAMGGLSVEDYYRVAPPDSFIHVYNFTSVRHLGKYLRHLMEDDAAYNRYHQWRDSFAISLYQFPKESVCKLCHLANHPEELQGNRKFADEWNNASNCR